MVLVRSVHPVIIGQEDDDDDEPELGKLNFYRLLTAAQNGIQCIPSTLSGLRAAGELEARSSQIVSR